MNKYDNKKLTLCISDQLGYYDENSVLPVKLLYYSPVLEHDHMQLKQIAFKTKKMNGLFFNVFVHVYCTV